MKKIYHFHYDCYKALVSIKVDTEIFTPEMAKCTLDFFSWQYDKEADPIDEVVKKYALEAIWGGLQNELGGLKTHFENTEGYARIDGSYGIEIVEFSPFEIDDNDLFLEKIEEIEK